MDDLAPLPETLYDRDFAAWAFDQADRLARGANGEAVVLDWTNLAEEVRSLAERDRRELASHIYVVVEHLLKLQASPATDPRDGWASNVGNARYQIELNLEANPSFRPLVPAMVARATPRARKAVQHALARYGETPRVLFELLDYTADKVTGDWWP